MNRKIVLSTKNQLKLAKQLGVAPITVRKALIFSSNSILARSIRETALSDYPSRLIISEEPIKGYKFSINPKN